MEFPHVVVHNWGFERWYANDKEKGYCGKELFFIRGIRGSLHYHPVKDEVMVVLTGLLQVEWYDGEWIAERVDEKDPDRLSRALHADGFCHIDRLYPGDRIHIPTARRHRLRGLRDTKVFEVSTFHDDNDVVKLIPAQAVVSVAASQIRPAG